MIKGILAFAILALFTFPASAHPSAAGGQVDDRYFDSRAAIQKPVVRKHATRHRRIARSAPKVKFAPHNLARGFLDEIGKASGDKMAGVVEPLRAKVREIVGSCGSAVISAIRHTYVAGTGGRLSLHASGRAVDIKGNPSCVYAHLYGWPGGYSVDYTRVQHVHVSYAPGGAEWGTRFRHYRGGHRKRR